MKAVITADEVRQRLMIEAEREGSQAALARKIGISRAFLCDIINGKREPSGKPVTYLGLRRDVGYVSL